MSSFKFDLFAATFTDKPNETTTQNQQRETELRMEGSKMKAKGTSGHGEL
jgi:hypothetical protein